MDPNADARYKVTFNTVWSSADFPVNFPSAAHFSSLIGATHNDQVKFWETGQLASDGIESMAETGSTSGLSSEVALAKTDGKAEFVLRGSGVNAVDTIVFEFDINESFPLVTLVSMVAPSPDWFVGVRDLSLIDDMTGDWKQSVELSLKVYDAGTDSGISFTSANADTPLPGVILLLTTDNLDSDFVNGVNASNQHLATISFTKISN